MSRRQREGCPGDDSCIAVRAVEPSAQGITVNGVAPTGVSGKMATTD